MVVGANFQVQTNNSNKTIKFIIESRLKIAKGIIREYFSSSFSASSVYESSSEYSDSNF